MRRLLPLCCGLAVCFWLAVTLTAAPPTEPAAVAEIVGRPQSLDVQPASITLDGPRATQQVLVSGRYADGSLRDLTCFCRFSESSEHQLLSLGARGVVRGRRDGRTTLIVRVGELSKEVPVTVVRDQAEEPISFRREFMPVLSVAGCSDIRCHGAPSGKNGFRLSLWGFDPDLDHQQLTRDAFGRRTNPLDPDSSLVLLKALAQIPHAGRQRFERDSRFAQLFRDWQAEGLRDERPTNRLESLTVTPDVRVLRAPARWQQLVVRATYDDGAEVDVTHLTTFSSTDLAVAQVERGGLVEFHGQGEAAILCRFLGKMVSARLMHIAKPPADYRWPNPKPANFVDHHVFNKLKMLNISPSQVCSDGQFIRRVFLDLCGILPTPDETRDFLASTATDKRSRLIDQLLQRPEYADYWTKKWLDVLRVSRDSIQLQGAQAYHRWLREQIEQDASLASIVRSMLTSDGDSYSAPAANFYCVTPTPKKVTDAAYLQKDLAEATAQLFLGVRLQCAQCHNHPYEQWTQDDYYALADFFTQVKRSRLGKAGPSGRPDRRQMAIGLDFDAAAVKREDGKSVAARLPGQPTAEFSPRQDRRRVLADWLTDKDNPYFAKALANRVWFHLHGRGIVEPVDDFRDSNPSANDALLDALAGDLLANQYRLKPLLRTIANSRTYQLSAQTNASNRKDTRYFSHMMARPLPAEVLLDSISDVTGVPETFEIMKDYIVGIPTEAVRLPTGTRAVQLPVNDLVTLINTSGKYVRYELHPFLRTFGQPNRTQTCECDREQKFGRKQALELITGPLVTAKVSAEQNRLGQLLAGGASDAEVLEELYLRALARRPEASAAKALLEHVDTSDDRRQAWEDVLWIVLNSQEFIYQH